MSMGTNTTNTIGIKSASMVVLDGHHLTFVQETNGDFYVTAENRAGLKLRNQENDDAKKIRQFILLNQHPLFLQNLAHVTDLLEQSLLARELVVSELTRSNGTGRRLDIALTFRDNEPVIVCGVGLKGGGFGERAGGVAAGAGLFILGVICIVATASAAVPTAILAYSIGGGALTGAGISSSVYAATADEKDYTVEGYVKQAAIGAVSGAVTGGAGGGTSIITQKLALEGLKKIGATIALDAAGSVVSNMASTFTEAELETDEKKKEEIRKNLTANKLAMGAVTSVVSSQIGQRLAKGVNSAAGKVTQKLFNQTDDIVQLAAQPALQAMSKTTKVVTGAMVGGAVGATMGGATKLVTNRLTDEKDIWKDVKKSATIGAISGSILCAARAADGYEDERSKLEQKVQNLKLIEQINADLFAELDQFSKQLLDDNFDPAFVNDIEEIKLKLKQNKCGLQELQQIDDTIKAIKEKFHKPQAQAAPQIVADAVEPTNNNQPAKLPAAASPQQPLTVQPAATVPPKALVRMYYFSRPLDAAGGDAVALLNGSARHAGIIIDDPVQGLIQIELGIGKHSANQLKITNIEEFHRQTDSNKGRWIYEVGQTDLSVAEITTIGERWIQEHPHYQTTNRNCRSFADHLLRNSFYNGHGEFISRECAVNGARINGHKYFKHPCEEIENRIQKDGFNTLTHVRAKPPVATPKTNIPPADNAGNAGTTSVPPSLCNTVMGRLGNKGAAVPLPPAFAAGQSAAVNALAARGSTIYQPIAASGTVTQCPPVLPPAIIQSAPNLGM